MFPFIFPFYFRLYLFHRPHISLWEFEGSVLVPTASLIQFPLMTQLRTARRITPLCITSGLLQQVVTDMVPNEPAPCVLAFVPFPHVISFCHWDLRKREASRGLENTRSLELVLSLAAFMWKSPS